MVGSGEILFSPWGHTLLFSIDDLDPNLVEVGINPSFTHHKERKFRKTQNTPRALLRENPLYKYRSASCHLSCMNNRVGLALAISLAKSCLNESIISLEY